MVNKIHNLLGGEVKQAYPLIQNSDKLKKLRELIDEVTNYPSKKTSCNAIEAFRLYGV